MGFLMYQTEITTQDEERLAARIEALVGGVVVSMSRQVRWRPSWFVDVEKDGDIVKIYARGDRNSDVVPFPDLRREADVLAVLGQHGIPAPHIYGMCEDPVTIIMECAPGTRDVVEAKDDEERRSVARQYIESLVAMHQLPLQPFVDIGVHEPEGAEEIALAGLKAYWPLYEKHKAAPDPLVEFAIRWLRRNYPRHRSTASFIAFDAGQFLFDSFFFAVGQKTVDKIVIGYIFRIFDDVIICCHAELNKNIPRFTKPRAAKCTSKNRRNVRKAVNFTITQ